eukprot:gene11429-8130_t
MNRIYLYSDEFSPDSVASVSEYERSSLNITMGMGGLKSADTSTLGDDDSRFDDPPYTRDSRKSVGHRPSFSHNNVSAEILDPTYSGTRVPSTIQQASPEQLRDDYVAVLQSYDAYSNSLKSLTVDTTVLVDKLSKALGIEGGVGTSVPSSIPSDDHVLARSVHADQLLLPSMPRDGGLSPRVSRGEPTPPSTENFLRSNTQYTNPRLWQSDTAAFLSRMHKDNLAAVHHHHAASIDPILPQVDASANTTNHLHHHNTSSQLLSTSQLPMDNSQQRVESLLSSTDGKMYYSARKPTAVADRDSQQRSSEQSSSTLASLLNVSQKEVDNLLLVTSLQSQGSRPPSTVPAMSGIAPARVENMAVNTSLRLSSEDIGQRLKSLEDKFSTIVTLLEKSEDGEEKKDKAGETHETLETHATNNKDRRHRSADHHRHDRKEERERSRVMGMIEAVVVVPPVLGQSPGLVPEVKVVVARNATAIITINSSSIVTKPIDDRCRITTTGATAAVKKMPMHRDTKRYPVSEDTASTASRESFSNSSRHTTDGGGGDGGDGGSTASTTSTLLKTVLGRKDGEGVDDLVSRILREAKEHGRLSEYTAASLRPQFSATTTTTTIPTGGPNDYADLLPSAKAAVDVSTAARSHINN